MKNVILSGFCVLIVCIVGGCEKTHPTESSSAKAPKVEVPVNVFTAPDETVLVRVNGFAITAKDFRDRYNLEEAIYRSKKTNATIEQLERGVSQFMGNRKLKILALLVNQQLITQYLAKESQKISEAEAQSEIKSALKKLAHKGTLEAYAGKLKVEAAYLKEQLLVPTEEKKAYERFGGGAIAITESDIDAGIARQDRYYERAVASNAVTYVTCSNLYNRIIKEKLDFIEAGRKYGQYSPDEAEYWARMEASEIENPKMRKWAFTAPIGSIGGPYDLEDGLSIVKIIDRTEGTLEESTVSLGVSEVTLARITFYMLEPEPEPRTRAFVRTALYNREKNRRLKKLFEKLHSEMKLDYPYGNNFIFDNGGTK